MKESFFSVVLPVSIVEQVAGKVADNENNSFSMAVFFITIFVSTIIGVSSASAGTQPALSCKAKEGFGTMVYTHGPVEMHAYNVPGDHVGPTISGGIEISIAGATYKKMKDTTFIFLPDKGVPYVVDVQAVAAGSFDLRLASLNNAKKIEKAIMYKDIQVTSDSQIEINLGLAGATPAVKIDSYGTAEYVPVFPTWINKWFARSSHKSMSCD